MTTLTETMIELADCRTTLYYFGTNQPEQAPLPLGTAVGYTGLYKKIAGPSLVTYDEATGRPGDILKKLSPVYHKNKYWDRVRGNTLYRGYPDSAWDFVLAILCSLRTRIEFVADPRFTFKVRPTPSVLLYPFGWSAWVSLRLTGPHTLGELADFTEHLFASRPFRLDPAITASRQGAAPFSLRDFFDTVAEGVLNDAFGATSKVFGAADPVLVTTVLAKHGGSILIDGLSADEAKALLRAVKPEGPPPKGTLQDHVYKLDPSSSEKYIVIDDYGRFIWMEDRLQPVGQNREHMRCYHNNSFNSLIQARHLYQLLTLAAKLTSLPASLQELTNAAIDHLSLPSQGYMNASLKAFLRGTVVTEAIAKMQKFNPKPDTSH